MYFSINSCRYSLSGFSSRSYLSIRNHQDIRYFSEWHHHIVPQGEAQTFAINARTNGRYYTSVNLSFLEPWLGGKRPNSFSLSAYFASQSGMSKRYYESYNNLYNYYNGLYGYNSYYGNSYNEYLQYQQATEVDPDTYLRTVGAAVGYGMRLNWPDDYFTFYGELSYQLYIKERTLVPIVEMTLNYKRALRFGMTPTIKITYRPTDSAKIIFDYEIYDSQTGELYLTAHTTQVFMDMENNLLWYSPEFYTEWKKSVGLI